MDGLTAGALIAFVTYSYTGSRLLGPLLAAALVVFAGKGRWRFVVSAWLTVLVALLPIGVYAIRHPGALTARYDATTIARDGLSGPRLFLEAIGNWLRDIDPWHWATAGDPAPYIHNGGYGAFFGSIAILAVAGAVLVLLRERADRWWRFVLLATLLVPIPAALTVDRYNAIRLAALPVFFLVLAIPAIDALTSAARRSWPARGALAILALVMCVQFVQFLDVYRTRGPGAARALRRRRRASPRGALRVRKDDLRRLRRSRRSSAGSLARRGARLAQSRIAILPDGGVPPPGSIVFLRFQDCDFVCEEVARWEEYRLTRAIGPPVDP